MPVDLQMNPTLKQSIAESLKIDDNKWKSELDKTSQKYHIVGAWIAIIFDPVFAFTDYINIREHFVSLFIFRISVSLLTLVTLFLFRRYNFKSYILVLVPFLLISFQNAYTFSLIDNAAILGHCLNYIALFIGGGMFILWPLPYSFLAVGLSIAATAYFISGNNAITLDHFWVNGGLLKLMVETFMIALIGARYRLTVKEIKARLALEESKKLLEEQSAVIADKNDKLMDSLQYAKRIQEAIFGNQNEVKKWFEQAFIMFKPKDIVSGDFYWLYRNKEKHIRIVIASDCTGHGVPAALMTVLGNTILTDIIENKEIYQPDEILYQLDAKLHDSLRKSKDLEDYVNDGMDISVLSFIGSQTYFSAAKNPLYIMRGSGIEIIKGSKYPIGASELYDGQKIFDKHQLDLEKGDRVYIFTDGYQDQFGGDYNKKFMSKRFRLLLSESGMADFEKQEDILKKTLQGWQAGEPQTDDILVIGLKI